MPRPLSFFCVEVGSGGSLYVDFELPKSGTSGFSGMEWWIGMDGGMMEWTGMVEWNGMVISWILLIGFHLRIDHL